VGDLKAFFDMSLGLKSTAVTQVPTAGAEIVADTTSGVANAVTFDVNGYYGAQSDLEIKRQNFSDATGVSPLTFNKVAAASGESAYTTMEVYDSLGTPLTMNLTTYMESRGDTGIVWRYIAQSPDNTNGDAYMQTGILTFNNEGQLVTSTGSPMGIIRTGSGAKAMSMYLNFDQMTSLTANMAGASQMLPQSQDGYKLGTLSSFSVGADGQINGSYTNGLTRSIGQVAIATFSNPNGLVDEGGNRFSSNSTSGVPVITAPGQLGSGTIRSSSLEMSNVDISTEFTNMIVASSGFSASSRVVSTANQLLTELLQSVR
jgi:flagellar hook protein FlgE